MNMYPPVPSATSSPVEHADWFELFTIGSIGRIRSLKDFTCEIRRTGSTDAIADSDDETYCSDIHSETSETIGEDAFSEVEWRLKACGGEAIYPFTVESGYLEFPEGKESSIYIFLLLLSVFGKDAGPKGMSGAKLFEDVCAEAGKAYFGERHPHTQSFVFGSPRSTGLPKRFDKAVDLLCRKMGEGRKFKNQYEGNYRHTKDSGLDIVIWRDFNDNRKGKLIAFGQCATGSNWKGKTGDLDVSEFCSCWLETSPVVDPMKLIFVPHRVEDNDWCRIALRGGLCFDRCRIAYCANNMDQGVIDRCAEWSQHAISERL